MISTQTFDNPTGGTDIGNLANDLAIADQPEVPDSTAVSPDGNFGPSSRSRTIAAADDDAAGHPGFLRIETDDVPASCGPTTSSSCPPPS